MVSYCCAKMPALLNPHTLSQTKPIQKSNPMKTTTFTRLFTLVITIAVTLLASCTSRHQQRQRRPQQQYQQNYQSGGYPSSGSYAGNSSAYQGNSDPSQYGRSTQGNNSQRKIVENGRQGHFMQRRHADGTAVGAPIWVPGKNDPDTYNGLPVHHHKATRMSADNLEKLLSEMNEPRQ